LQRRKIRNKIKFKNYAKITVMKKFITVILILFFGIFLTHTFTASSQTLTAQERARLQTQYDQLQTEIAEWQKVLDETKAKKNTLQGDVTILNAQYTDHKIR
jgi:DNA gyrase/topoisomerase IV subunit A